MMLLPLTNQAVPCTRGVAHDVPCQMVGAYLAVHSPTQLSEHKIRRIQGSTGAILMPCLFRRTVLVRCDGA
jgi:hypothetical protein